MPPRDPELPEGTDQIVNGASAAEGAGGTNGGGFVATGGGGDTGGTSAGTGTADKLVSQVREQVTSLRGQATDKLRGFADDGKGRATGLLEDISSIIEDAARSIDERLGEEYGNYAHRASGAVSSFAEKVRDKSVEDLLDDTRSVVRTSPTIAIAAAAVVGFALMRVVRTGLDDSGGGGRGRNRKGDRA
ncbi:MAG TPA: hypothetical protein VN231_09880 [Allosphingosinicella sp.]|nr:hypothetical protein [Allosphingosinicella sp.]